MDFTPFMSFLYAATYAQPHGPCSWPPRSGRINYLSSFYPGGSSMEEVPDTAGRSSVALCLVVSSGMASSFNVVETRRLVR